MFAFRVLFVVLLFGPPTTGVIFAQATPPALPKPPVYEVLPKKPDGTRKIGRDDVLGFHDPVFELIEGYQEETKKYFVAREFSKLEAEASELRKNKTLFSHGLPKIIRFYESFGDVEKIDSPADIWEVHDELHRDWMEAMPDSVTAATAYAYFLTEYARHARGDGIDTHDTLEGLKLYVERMQQASETAAVALSLQEKDSFTLQVMFTIAQRQGWDDDSMKKLIEVAHNFDPTFWGYDVARSYSLLSRWGRKVGDWDAFARETAARPDGLGAELYARIVINRMGDFKNVFEQAPLSWPLVKEGMAQMRKKYPDSAYVLQMSARLASLALDRETACELFDKLEGKYEHNVWSDYRVYVRYWNWAHFGEMDYSAELNGEY